MTPPATDTIRPMTMGRESFSRKNSHDANATQIGAVVTSTTDEVTVV